jgi:hypothetical protein
MLEILKQKLEYFVKVSENNEREERTIESKH